MNISPGKRQPSVLRQQAGMMPQQSVINPHVQQVMPGPAQERLDNISKVKSLVEPLKEVLAALLKNAAQIFHENSILDRESVRNVPPVDVTQRRFVKSLEEFYSICDHIELHLKTAIECTNQSSSSNRYMPQSVAPTKMIPIHNQELNILTYPQYLSTVRTQLSFAKEVHDMLLAAAQNISSNGRS